MQQYKTNYGFRRKKAPAMGAPMTPAGQEIVPFTEHLKERIVALERENARLRKWVSLGFVTADTNTQ